MPKFILVEHSLRSIGGHHYEFARELLAAAEKAGFELVLGTSCEFRDLDRLPSNWRVIPEFPVIRHRPYHPPGWWLGHVKRRWPEDGSIFGRLKELMALGRAEFGSALDRMNSWSSRSKDVRGFAQACERMFATVPLEEGDQVFLSTMEEHSFLGLAAFLRETPATRSADWHLQFQFQLFSGRDPDQLAQERRARRLRRWFQGATERLVGWRLFLYTTTEELSRQFERLGVGEIGLLPWPVSEKLRKDERKPSRSPLRIVIAGALRRDKGSRVVVDLVNALRESAALKSVQLLIQGNPKKTKRLLASTRAPIAFPQSFDLGASPSEPVVALPHPLGSREYLELLRFANVGLLLNDADQFAARASGPLTELLAAGTPVLVPSGSWLSAQIEEENQRYLEETRATTSEGHELEACDGVGEEVLRASVSFEVPADEGDLLISVARQPQAPGRFTRVIVVECDAGGSVLSRKTGLVGSGPGPQGRGDNRIMFHLRPDAQLVRVALRQAFGQAPEPDAGLHLTWLQGRRPLGAVGLAYGSVEELPELVQDLVQHYDHYAERALRFAAGWSAEHSVGRVIDLLTSRSARGRRLGERSGERSARP